MNYAKVPAPAQVAVVGSGQWGLNLVRNFHQLGALRTICDTNPATLQSQIDTYPGIRGVTDLREVLNDPEVAGVVVATPAETHAAIVFDCLRAGKDVYVEKPLCLSIREGEQLMALAGQNDRVLMVGHLLWYHPAVLKLKELMDSGELGQIQYIYSNRLNLGKLRREENVLWSFAPHDISLILGLTGEMPTQVWAQGGNYLRPEIADVTISALKFPSGVRAHLFVSWLHPFKEQKLVVVGQKKMAVFNDLAPWSEKLQLYAHHIEWPGNVPVAHRAEAENVPVTEMEPLRLECQHFLECIATRQLPRTDGREALRVLQVLNACQAVLEEGRPILLKAEPPGWTEIEAGYFVHPSAEVDPDVVIGQGTKIWRHSYLMTGTRIGERCNVGQNVVLGPNVTIGNGCKIQNNVSVYEGVVLEDDVFCGPSMVFTNVINPRSHIPRKHEIRPTLVKRGATIGANATILCGHTLGEYCFVGAGSVVTKNVPAYALVLGCPAKQMVWMCVCGMRLFDDFKRCMCGAEYNQLESELSPAD
ncbi:MAG: Gfo/Idh/MocA family oxidoreductase [Deltaproteobacteria bacterium]|nr:Gfo/Idh/MocA family oxidoreductase [Deltaproteobacteria bacterium]